jgi:hypothetical protein
MSTRTGITLAAALTALAAAAAALAGDSGAGPICTVEAKPSYRLAKASTPGMPVRITCDGPARVFAAVDLLPGPAERNVNRKAHPGSDGFSSTRSIPGQTARTFHVKLASYARKAVKKAGGSKIVFILGVKKADGYFHNNPGPGGSDRSKLIVD